MAEHAGGKAKRVIKQIVSFETSTPETEPLFVNNIQVSYHGHDAFLDLGVMALDDLLGDNSSEEARFLVVERVAMSVWSLVGMQIQIDRILEDIQRKGTLDVSQMRSEYASMAAQVAAIAEAERTKKSGKPGKQSPGTKS